MEYIIRCTNNGLVNGGFQSWFQFYQNGVRYLTIDQNVSSNLTLNFHVTDNLNNPIANTEVYFNIGKAYSGSNAIVSYDGVFTSGIDSYVDQLNVIKTTDNNGNVSFTINGSSISGKYTQVYAYVHNSMTDIIDIIDIRYISQNQYIVRCTNNGLVDRSSQPMFEFNKDDVRYLTIDQNVSSNLTLNFHVTDNLNIPMANTEVYFNIGKAYSGSNAIVSYNGIFTSGIDRNVDQLNVIKTTDNNGNVSFTINGSSIIGKYTQVYAYVHNSITDIVDIIDIRYNKYLKQISNYINIQSVKLSLEHKLNIFGYNNDKIDYSKYNFFSSNTKIATMNNFGTIIPISKGKFYFIITNENSNIVYSLPYLIEIV